MKKNKRIQVAWLFFFPQTGGYDPKTSFRSPSSNPEEELKKHDCQTLGKAWVPVYCFESDLEDAERRADPDYKINEREKS